MSPRTMLRERAAAAINRLRPRGNRPAPGAPAHSDLDRWMVPLFGDELRGIESRLGESVETDWSLFRGLDDDLWALLLTREFDAFPGIRNALPDLPPKEIQEQWNGASGPALAAQGVAFYRKVKELQARFGDRPLSEARVLDVGCGWGRLTRMFARDVAPGNLYGCDPVEEILDACRQNGVPAELARSEFLPERFPFETRFDLIYAFSVITHVSAEVATALARAASASLESGGLYVLTIRPPAYLDVNPLMAPVLERLGEERERTVTGSAYLFEPHAAENHPQFDGREMTYGEAMVTLPWIRENWPEFELVDVAVMTADIYQTVVTLRKR